MTHTSHQVAIFDGFRNTARNMAINACAGSGKTTTTMELAKLVPSHCMAIYIAFSKAIVTEMEGRPNKPWNLIIKTCHSAGLMFANRRIKLDNYKIGNIIKSKFPDFDYEDTEGMTFMFLLRDHIELVMTQMLRTEEEWMNKVSTTDIELTDEITWARITAVMRESLAMFNRSGEITFTEMIYLPVIQGKVTKNFDVLFIDEAQDLNKLQQEFVTALGKRIIVVGDPRQSIMGFAGADTSSFGNLVAKLEADVYDLPVSFRCGSAIIEKAQIYNPKIQPKEGAHTGEVLDITYDEFVNQAKAKDLVICRTNAELISAAFAFLRAGKPVSLRGKDLATNMVNLLKRLSGGTGRGRNRTGVADFTKLSDRIDNHFEKERKKLERKRNAAELIANLTDQEETLNILYVNALGAGIDDLKGFGEYVNSLYDDEDKSSVISLCTIHRSKGLEANRVFWIESWKCPLSYAVSKEAVQQEYNLVYVAITRAKDSLFMVASKKGTGSVFNFSPPVDGEEVDMDEAEF